LLSDEDRAFVDEVHNRWLNFIKSGDPNDGADVGAEWAPYTPDGKETLVLNEDSHMEASEQADDIEFLMSMVWDEW
jgi:para-nitrobenzyl esterase